MARRCDRPACSEPAAVAYGFDATHRLVWLDRLLDEDRARSGALCQRHAQRLTVPKGWWLDDRRVSAPEMFRDASGDEEVAAAEATPARRPRKPRKPRARAATTPVASEPDAGPADAGQPRVDEPVAEPPDVVVSEPSLPLAELGEDLAAAGTVTFEETVVVEDQSELIVAGDVVLEEAIVYEEPEAAESNPLLEPSSPLLARAFTGVARTDGPRRRSRRNGIVHPPPTAEPPAAPEPPA